MLIWDSTIAGSDGRGSGNGQLKGNTGQWVPDDDNPPKQ